jgi:surfeit locus 1 family protein
VNRGWIPRQGNQPDFATPAGFLTIAGQVNIPEPPAIQLAQATEDSDATPHWPFLTLEHFADWSGLEILPFMILQDASNEAGFVRQWPQPHSNEGMHIGYAIQWFAFAMITLAIWLRLSLHKQPTKGAS